MAGRSSSMSLFPQALPAFDLHNFSCGAADAPPLRRSNPHAKPALPLVPVAGGVKHPFGELHRLELDPIVCDPVDAALPQTTSRGASSCDGRSPKQAERSLHGSDLQELECSDSSAISLFRAFDSSFRVLLPAQQMDICSFFRKDDANANRRTRILNQLVDEWRDTPCTKTKKTPMMAAIPKRLPRAE
jgi:hypothetical protein